MSKVKSKDTKPEMIVRRFLHSRGFRYRLHVKSLPGKPDIVFRGRKTVIFVHGCFWHRHEGCRYARIPKSNTGWWIEKLNRNRTRDLCSAMSLEQAGWRIVTIFQCELKPKDRHETLYSLELILNETDVHKVALGKNY